MTGKVFISCGQASAEEKEAAQQVSKLLKDEFHFNTPYLAITVQGLRDIE